MSRGKQSRLLLVMEVVEHLADVGVHLFETLKDFAIGLLQSLHSQIAAILVLQMLDTG